MSTAKATHQATKQHNRDLVLRTIFEHETISRAEIARLTQLTRTTVSEVVSVLMEAGLVREIGPGSSIGGKPSIQLGLLPDSRYLIGLNLAQNRFMGSVVNLRGEIQKTVEVPVGGHSSRKAIQSIYKIVDKLMNEKWVPIVGLGVGTPGLIDTRAGARVNAVNLDWQGLPLAGLLEERYHLPARILNDSQATAIGEFVYGDHGSDDNLIVLNAGYGIGAGILIHGRLFQGDGGGAGEIGHVQVKENGRPCRCGRRGCLETLASGWAILQAVQHLPGSFNVKTLKAVEKKFNAGDLSVRKIVLEAGHSLGLAIGSLVGTLDIKKIVLSGDITRFGKPWLDAVRAGMSGAALGHMTQETQLEIGKLDDHAGILGAAAYLLLNDYSFLFQQEN